MHKNNKEISSMHCVEYVLYNCGTIDKISRELPMYPKALSNTGDKLDVVLLLSVSMLSKLRALILY